MSVTLLTPKKVPGTRRKVKAGTEGDIWVVRYLPGRTQKDKMPVDELMVHFPGIEPLVPVKPNEVA